jgi:hypothetical protein
LLLDGALPADGYPNAEAPLTVRVRAGDRTLCQATRAGAPFPIEIALPGDALEAGEWTIEMAYAYCTAGAQSLCVPARQRWRVPVRLDSAGASELYLAATAATPRS